ncbi:MAG: cytochrome b/b6 domain-containing protein [Myxococcales bacterium]|jgi:cytochrome b561|nr:cytochrome b/b6 domain-containing protein [Myxococcales bacterium]
MSSDPLATNGEEARWPRASMIVHAAGAALVIGLAGAGFVMSDAPAGSGARLLLSRLHTLLGAGLMILTVARLVLRARGPKPPPLELLPVHRMGMGFVHVLLYVVTFAIGASGFATGATSAWPDYLGGRLPEAPDLHALVPRQAHEALVFALLGLVFAHVAGVMIHQVRKGGVLGRMIPFLK